MNKIKIHHLLLFGLFLLTISGCKKEEVEVPKMETGTVTDISGITYQTVKIGNQWWMAEDLKTTKYRDSSFIGLITIDTTWAKQTIGAYCNVLSNSGAVPIGKLYNYYAITDPRGIAPIGWHIPSDAEWQTMEQSLGMSSSEANGTAWRGTHEGEKMKVMRGTTYGWTDYGNIWTTNESGFNALALGCRMHDGTWGDPGQAAIGFWWTATATGTEAWYRYLDYKNANVFRYHGLRTYGFSVRCVKD